MKIFCQEEHTVYSTKLTKWVFSFVGTYGYLGKGDTKGSLKEAIFFDEEPHMNDSWEILRKHHPKSVLFNYLNPYRIAEVEIAYRVIEEN